MRLLYEEGLACRLPYFDLDQENGTRTFVYGLSAKGCAFAVDNGWFSHSCKPLDEHSQRTLDHELEIASFHAALKKFCMASGLALYWQQKDLRKTVAPDALFAITDPKQPEGRDTLYYFLEIERAKIGNFKDGKPSILRKLGRYYEYYDADKCENEWEYFRQFKVIVVQQAESRRQHLLKKLRESYNHRMFWLTIGSAYRSSIGAAIFLAPRDYDTGAYSFDPACKLPHSI